MRHDALLLGLVFQYSGDGRLFGVLLDHLLCGLGVGAWERKRGTEGSSVG